MDKYSGGIPIIVILFSDYKKRIIRIIVGIRGRDSCTEHCKKLRILPLQSQYALSILLL